MLSRLKEWVYAGAVINYASAAASHLIVGDGIAAITAPVALLALTVTSWALSEQRRLRGGGSFADGRGRPREARANSCRSSQRGIWQAAVGKRGYNEDEVDALLDRIHAKLLNPSDSSLTAADIHSHAFSKPPWGKRGYNEDEVDALLDRVEAEIRRLGGV